jgi:hypothetical protein
MAANSFMKTKSVLSFGAPALICFNMLAGCTGPELDVTSGAFWLGPTQEQFRVSEKLSMGIPDTDAWHDQRQKLALATGDRVFDKDFARVFDSLVQAVASLEIKVNNMERQSGYIAASGITLSPAEKSAMRNEALTEWCRLNGIDPLILDRPFVTAGTIRSLTVNSSRDEAMSRLGLGRSLTFQLVKMGTNQTKVKLRFSDVNYPREVDAYYKLVWQAVDKQIFVDKNIEGAVEKRQ